MPALSRRDRDGRVLVYARPRAELVYARDPCCRSPFIFFISRENFSNFGKIPSAQATNPWSLSGLGTLPWHLKGSRENPFMCFRVFRSLHHPQESAPSPRDLVCIPPSSLASQVVQGGAGSVPGWRKTPWRRTWQPTPVFLPGKIPWMKQPGGLQSMGSQRAGCQWARMFVTCRKSSPCLNLLSSWPLLQEEEFLLVQTLPQIPFIP